MSENMSKTDKFRNQLLLIVSHGYAHAQSFFAIKTFIMITRGAILPATNIGRAEKVKIRTSNYVSPIVSQVARRAITAPLQS